MYYEAKNLLDTIQSYARASDGDSTDAEIDAAIEMRDSAIALLRAIGEFHPEISALIQKYSADEPALAPFLV